MADQFIYRERPGQSGSPMRGALRILSRPPEPRPMPVNPLGLRPETLAKIEAWNAGVRAFRAGKPRPTDFQGAGGWDSAKKEADHGC